MNGPAGLRGLVALALALAIPPCASGATNLCGGTALGPLDADGSEVLSIALAPIAGGQELQPPWDLASTGSTALTPTTLREGIASGAIPTITLVTTTTVLPITTLSTTTFTLPVTTLTLSTTTPTVPVTTITLLTTTTTPPPTPLPTPPTPTPTLPITTLTLPVTTLTLVTTTFTLPVTTLTLVTSSTAVPSTIITLVTTTTTPTPSTSTTEPLFELGLTLRPARTPSAVPEQMGAALAVRGDTLLIGAPRDGSAAPDAGIVYVVSESSS